MKGILSVIFILFGVILGGLTPFDLPNFDPQSITSGDVSTSGIVQAAVRVKGYYRKDGTYVQPHYRSNPDGNPYNNWSFPGNTNPFTGETASGNPDTYLKNYCEKAPNNSYCTGLGSLPTATINTVNLATLPDNTLIRREGTAQVYRVNGGKKYWIPTRERFEAFGYRWSDIRVVPYDFTDGTADGTVTYREGILLRSPGLPFVWLITSDFARKWIPDAATFNACKFDWRTISTVPESEIQSLNWVGDVTTGKVAVPSCS